METWDLIGFREGMDIYLNKKTMLQKRDLEGISILLLRVEAKL